MTTEYGNFNNKEMKIYCPNATKSGEIKTVVTKDLSRLGRNYLQVGMYTDV